MFDNLLLNAIAITAAIIGIVIFMSYELNKDKLKRLDFILEEEVRVLNRIGLDSRIESNGFTKRLFFYHPSFIFETKYNFNMMAARNIQDTFMAMDSVLNVKKDEFKKIIKTIFKTSSAFIKENSLESYPLSHVIPLIFIFDFNIDSIRAALESEIHPAVIAAISEQNDALEIIKTTEGLKDMPIEWLAEIYNFSYTSKTTMVGSNG